MKQSRDFHGRNPILFEDLKKRHPGLLKIFVAIIVSSLFLTACLGITIRGIVLLLYVGMLLRKFINPSYKIPFGPNAPKYKFLIWILENGPPKKRTDLHGKPDFLCSAINAELGE